MQVCRNQDGFTLIEVAVALTSVAILSVGVMLSFTTSGAQDRRAYETTRAQNVCVSMMEQIEASTFDELSVLAGVPFNFSVGKWSFRVLVTQLQNDLLAIETATWPVSEPRSSVRVVTLKARKDEAL